MKFKLVVFMALLVAAAPQLMAAVITGQVIDRSGLPIENVNIKSSGLDQTVKTDRRGRFELNLSSGEATAFTFSHAGFVPKTIRLEPGEKSVTVTLRQQVYPMEGMTVTSGRAVEGRTPIAFQNISEEEIDRDYDFGEIPALLESTPNLYSFSDAGGGLGYSYIKMRGFDARRTPVYINGIPLNDPEDHALYFVDLPDFAETVDNIQVQRGVGNSLYADAAFGGSVNMLLSPLSRERAFRTEFGYGSFMSEGDAVGVMRKKSVEYTTGLLGSGWSLSGRWIEQYSDGYRERSWYEGTAYYLSLSRLDPNMITTLNIYGGPMRTHAAWDGITKEMLEENRRYNPFIYDNETDNFDQPHAELHHIYNFGDNVSLYNTLYYIRGTGYYEQYIPASWDYLYTYNLTSDSSLQSDLIRRKKGEKNQYGLNSQLSWRGRDHETSVGAGYYFFESEHWGEVIWAEELDDSYLSVEHPFRYFEHFGKIHNLSAYAMRMQRLGDNLTLNANLQIKYLNWSANQTPFGIYQGHTYDIDWLFLSPRVGATYAFSDRLSSFIGFSIASHVPNDDMIDDTDNPADTPRLDFIRRENNLTFYGDPQVDPERVYDIELGANYRSDKTAFGVNLFWMEYMNEIVPDGGLNDDRFPTYGNADRSIHRGIETSWTWKILPRLKFEGNYSFNDNIIKEYDQIVGYDSEADTALIVEHRDVTVPAFPDHMGNFVLQYDYGTGFLSYRLRTVGRQNLAYSGRYYTIDGEAVDVSIDPYAVSSLKAAYNIGDLFGAALTVEGRVDNIFDVEYETYGYQWGDAFYYWPAAERNWFVSFTLTVK